jgi:20S proteasome subunit alpha 4
MDCSVLVNKARLECQSYRLTVEDKCSVDYIARHIAYIQQQSTQRGGRRPFGISTLIIGFDADGSPRLYQTDPSGSYSSWRVGCTRFGGAALLISVRVQANATGRNSKTVREFLEKNYKDDQSDEDAVKLAVRALLEVVESGSKNIEIAVLRQGAPLVYLSPDEIEVMVEGIEKEKQEDEAKKRQKSGTK